MMKKFYDQGGVQISDAAMDKEFDTRPTFDLDAAAQGHGPRAQARRKWTAGSRPDRRLHAQAPSGSIAGSARADQDLRHRRAT